MGLLNGRGVVYFWDSEECGKILEIIPVIALVFPDLKYETDRQFAKLAQKWSSRTTALETCALFAQAHVSARLQIDLRR